MLLPAHHHSTWTWQAYTPYFFKALQGVLHIFVTAKDIRKRALHWVQVCQGSVFLHRHCVQSLLGTHSVALLVLWQKKKQLLLRRGTQLFLRLNCLKYCIFNHKQGGIWFFTDVTSEIITAGSIRDNTNSLKILIWWKITVCYVRVGHCSNISLSISTHQSSERLSSHILQQSFCNKTQNGF